MNKDSKKNMSSGTMISSPLFRRFLAPMILTILGFTGAVYLFAIPYLNNLVYSLEEKSVKANLTNIRKLIEANYLAIEAYKKSVTSAHERQLKNITLFMETYLKNKYDQVQQGIIPEDEAKRSALDELRAFRYGNDDYVWVADYHGTFLSHPDPNMHLQDFSDVRDVFGNYVLTPLIQQALENGEGYYSYWWQRLANDLPAEQLTYAKFFPEWEWVIGTGVYLDDLETEVILRKEKMIEELRQILKPISIAKTGYMYIFDSWHNIIIHPDTELENTDMSSWNNPSTGNKLVDDLKASSHSEYNKVAYTWNRPDDKARYIYNKIDWTTHVDEFGWYVVASVYEDELNTSSVLLRDRIIILAVTVIILAIIIISLLMSRLLNPIRRLSETARLVESGDLNARSDVKSEDELGFLARAFNSMIAQLREIIEKLDQKVLERTEDLNRANEELTTTVGKLEQYNWRVTQLNRMAEKLQACHAMEDIYTVIMESLSGLFHQASGVLYSCSVDERQCPKLTPVIKWGADEHTASEYEIYDCRSFSEGRVVLVDVPGDDILPCEHVQQEAPYISICMPLFGQKEALGMINLTFTNVEREFRPNEKRHMLENWQHLATTVADQLSMALANMQLRERLRELSVRDGLTGLFNRRYMEESLEREFIQAERSKKPVGIIILDVDFFKKFNDTYGHEAGDVVLIKLASLFSNSIRKGDIVCRYGGEEFVIILPGATAESAVHRAELIRSRVEMEMSIPYNDHQLNVTVSLGTAVFPDHGSSPEEVLKAADDALYKAKAQGRNRTVSASRLGYVSG